MLNILVQTGPAIAISFCLITVRLGTTKTEARGDTWGNFQRSRASRMMQLPSSRFSGSPNLLDRVKVERDVYVSKSESGAMEFHVVDPNSPADKRSFAL
jgi:hypothetical protein